MGFHHNPRSELSGLWGNGNPARLSFEEVDHPSPAAFTSLNLELRESAILELVG